MVEAVHIRSAGNFFVGSERFEAPAEKTETSELVFRLTNALYQRKYCRPVQGSFQMAQNARAVRVFVEQLSHANCGTGTWESDCVIEKIEADGTRVVRRRRDDLLLWARPHQFRPTIGESTVGSVGRLWIGKESREMFPGYYAMFGDADRANGEQIVRFYWHLTPQGAQLWTRELTERFNAAGVSFHAKVISDPAAFLRADAGVLYVEHRHVPDAMALMRRLHSAVAVHLRQATPMFTKRLARGLAVAEDPGDGRSFGQHRCHLVSEGLVRAFTAGDSGFEQVVAAVEHRFAEDGLTVKRPWLSAGSPNTYHWPKEP
jgi:HopA1 effector protein family